MLDLTATRLGRSADAGPLLIVGPSLGTSVEALWTRCARQLGNHFEVVGWDLPGHGRGRPVGGPFTIADLADAVRRLASPLRDRGEVWYAGDSLGGVVGFQLAVDPGPFDGVVTIASAPKIATAPYWHERADLVEGAGTEAMVAGSIDRWFAPGFMEREPEVSGSLLTSLVDADSRSYSAACRALAHFDVRDLLATVAVPVLVATGEFDTVIPPDLARRTAAAIPGAELVIFAGCGHLPPAEDPAGVATALHRYISGRELVR